MHADAPRSAGETLARHSYGVASRSAEQHAGKLDHVLNAYDLTSRRIQVTSSESDIATLADFMQLPVKQYALIPMPFGASLERDICKENMGGELFRLTVPPIRIPGLLTVEPLVMCNVTSNCSAVLIESIGCELLGKQAQDLGLNNLFEFYVRAVLTWTDTPKSQQIQCETSIHIELDPPQKFRFIPKVILEAMGNTAVAAALKLLHRSFLRSLADDFSRWASDETYRREREVFCTVGNISSP